MRRSYEYHGHHHHSRPTTPSPASDYLHYITQPQMMPSMISDIPPYHNMHEVRANDVKFGDKNASHQHQKSHVNHHKHHVPEVHKKVHFVEHDEITKIDKNGVHRVHGEEDIDVEADGFIQHMHKHFDLCKYDTFKAS